ncbi:cord and cs domain protein [Lentinula edodes]|uniref:Cord and cs domain protein n=1 Tax=Lentinula edodes TaxID=5353 RepID=A0A1Q3EGJ8_LENED|nr:cord and cs domain protein [Lentinula edodes]
MPRCTRKGCGKEFPEGSTERCTFHPGAPVFHEGLKSWSCCSDKNKPVLDFDEFMKIMGCVETDRHTNDVPDPESKAPVAFTAEKEVAKAPSKVLEVSAASSDPAPPPATAKVVPATLPVVTEEDDLSVSITPGTSCRRKGCSVTFISDDENRLGDGEGTRCKYHPAPPIFREGSKGYMCCKRRVLEFEEFLKIEGCQTGRHLFSPKVNTDKIEEFTTCRLDHYQTLDQVHVSVFAKQVDKDRSNVKINEQSLSIDLYLPGSKRFFKTINLFGPITPEQSTVQYFGTKVEVHLKKQDTRSWTILEKPTHDLGNIALTFGVTGRTGTIGAKESVLDAQNSARDSITLRASL